MDSKDLYLGGANFAISTSGRKLLNQLILSQILETYIESTVKTAWRVAAPDACPFPVCVNVWTELCTLRQPAL